MRAAHDALLLSPYVSDNERQFLIKCRPIAWSGRETSGSDVVYIYAMGMKY